MNAGSYFVGSDWVWQSGLDLTSCIIFSVIYGYSQDEDSSFYGNIELLAGWAKCDERTARRKLSMLVASGYVRRSQIGRGRGAYIVLSCAPEIVSKMKKGDNLPPLKRGTSDAKKGGTGCKKGGHSVPDTSLIYIKNILNNYSLRDACASRAQEEEEFFKLFFWKNAAVPAVEVAAFLSYNDVMDAKEIAEGTRRLPRSYEEKLILADTKWQFKKGSQRVNSAWLDTWHCIYIAAKELGGADAAMADNLVDPCMHIESDDHSVVLHAPKEVAEWIDKQILKRGRIRDILATFLRKRKFNYQYTIK